MVTRSPVTGPQTNNDPQELAKHVVLEYLKAQHVITDEMSAEQIKEVIEHHLTTISANKLIELLGVIAQTDRNKTVNAVTPELQNKKDMLQKRMDADLEMSASAKRTIAKSVRAFGLIRPDDDITLTEKEIDNIEKSAKAFGMVAPKASNEQRPMWTTARETVNDAVDKPVPKTPAQYTAINHAVGPCGLLDDEVQDARELGSDTDTDGADSEATSVKPPSNISDMAMQNLQHVYQRLDESLKQMVDISHDISMLLEYHKTSAPIMMKDPIAAAHNNLKVEAVMRSSSTVMNRIEDNLKNMHTMRLDQCRQYYIASPKSDNVETNLMNRFNKAEKTNEELPGPLLAGTGATYADVGREIAKDQKRSANAKSNVGMLRRSGRTLVMTETPKIGGSGEDPNDSRDKKNKEDR